MGKNISLPCEICRVKALSPAKGRDRKAWKAMASVPEAMKVRWRKEETRRLKEKTFGRSRPESPQIRHLKSTAPHLGMPPIRAPIYTKICHFQLNNVKI